MEWYPCGCAYDPPPCNVCTSDAATVTVEISGMIVDHCANCASFDGTYVLTRTGSNACTWRTSRYGSGCSGSPFFFGLWMTLVLEAKVLAPSANQGWELLIQLREGTYVDPYSGNGDNNARYRWNSGGSADFDCTATRSLTLFTYVPDPTAADNPCDTSSLTVTVNP